MRVIYAGYFLLIIIPMVFYVEYLGIRGLPDGAPVPDVNSLPNDQWYAVRTIDGLVYERYKYQLEPFKIQKFAGGRSKLTTRLHFTDDMAKGVIVDAVCFPQMSLQKVECDFSDGRYFKNPLDNLGVVMPSMDGKIRGYPFVKPEE